MSELQGKILNLCHFRADKLTAAQARASASAGSQSHVIENHMENIKQSIQRINSLMDELRVLARPNLESSERL